MRRRTIRFRITAIASAAVAGVLIVGGVALVILQRNVLTAGLDEALAQRANDIVALLDTGDVLPTELPASAREGFAQVVGPGGIVLVSTPNLAGVPPLEVDAGPGPGDTFRTIGLVGDDDPFRVLSRSLDGLGILHVGASSETVTESITALITSLALTIPMLVLALAVIVWWLVGSTLRPVEDIRFEVAEIGASELNRRVPRPGTEDEIDRLADTMNQMLERVHSSVERQHRFVADASHELRSPLTRIRSELEVDLAESDGSDGRAFLQRLLDEVVGLQHLVEDLLYLARADAGLGPAGLAPVDLDDLVLREARRIQAHGRVEVDLSAVSAAHVTGDAGQLTRAIRNLLDNAERHSVRRITASLAELDRMAILVVADDGPGIPAEEAGRVFERFGRLDEARSSESGGTGLGLAIAREIAEGHRGSLTLAAQEGPGAKFELRIPLAD